MAREDVMATIESSNRRLLRLFLSGFAAVIVTAATHQTVSAGEGHTFVLPASDAYGAADCQGKTAGCSAVVASAFCESHGYAEPIAYGRAEDMTTGTTATAMTGTESKIDPNAYVVTCSE
jgi:hypothetical protein